MMSRNSGKFLHPNSARVHISGENRAGRSPRAERYDRGPGARTPNAISASFASAMMNAREEGFALISASLASRDFMANQIRCSQSSKQAVLRALASELAKNRTGWLLKHVLSFDRIVLGF